MSVEILVCTNRCGCRCLLKMMEVLYGLFSKRYVFVVICCTKLFMVLSENVELNIGVIANECSSHPHINESVLTSTTAWSDNISVRLHWTYINSAESYLLLQSVHNFKQQSIDSVILADDVETLIDMDNFMIFDQKLPVLSLGKVNTSSNRANTEIQHCDPMTSLSSNTGTGSSCKVPYVRTNISVTPNVTAQLSMLASNVISTLQYLKWTSIIILFEKEAMHHVDLVIMTLSNVVQISYIVDDLDDTKMKNVLSETDRSDLKFSNITLICQSTCTTRVLSAVGRYVDRKHRTSSLRHRSRWLVFELTDEPTFTWTQYIDKIDNVAAVTVPLQFVGKGMKLNRVDSLIRKVLYLVGSNASMQNVSKTEMTSNLLNSLVTESQKCHWSTIETLMWKKKGREWNNVAYIDADGRLLVDTPVFPNAKFGFNGRRFDVSTLEWDPFVSNENGKFSGLCFDVLEQLSHTLNFTYTAAKPPDGQWGVEINGSWTGLVGQLARKEVDLVVAPLSTQATRERVMDFTYSYYIDYTTIVMRKVDPAKTKWRTLIDPFSDQLLICIAISLPVMSLLLFLFERFSPYYLDDSNKGDRSGLHTYQDSFWYMYGALLTQGGEHLPRSITGRTLLSFWWVFCIILMATYSGNLIAFLTVNKSKVPFTNIQEMVAQNTYQWGTIGGTSWTSALQESKRREFQKIWEGIKEFNRTDPEVLNTNPEVHFQKVLKGEYGYIGDKTQIEIKMSSECELATVTDEFLPLQYALGLPNNSPFTKLFSDEIIDIHASGLLHIWKQRRWPKQSICDGELVTVSKTIEITDVQSAFYLIGIGVVVASLVLCIEYFKDCIAKRNLTLKQRAMRMVNSNGHNHQTSM